MISVNGRTLESIIHVYSFYPNKCTLHICFSKFCILLKTVKILISWLLVKPDDQDLNFFINMIDPYIDYEFRKLALTSMG